MDTSQLIQIQSDWQFLTPSSTPTTTSFDGSTIQTPALNAHFHDAFTTPYLELSQHGHSTANPTAPPLDYGDGSFFSQQNMYTHHHGFPTEYQPQVPLHQPNRAPPSLAPAAPIGKEYQDAASSHPIYPTPPELHQMSTPPPTRGTSERKLPQRADPVVFGTPSSITRSQIIEQQTQPGNYRVPYTDHSPQNVTQLSHPQPVFPFQQQPLHEQLTSQSNVVFAQPHHLDSAGSTQQAWAPSDDPFSMEPASWAQSESAAPLSRSYSTASGLGRNSAQKPRRVTIQTARNPNPNYGGHLYGPRQSPEKRRITHASVDPSLVYSSPSRPPTSDGMISNPLSRSSSSASLSRVPYQHSLTDPRQELGSSRSARFRPPPPPQLVQPQPPSKPVRPGLPRSNTVSSMTSLKSFGSVDLDDAQSAPLVRSNSFANIPRRSSPLKRERIVRGSLSSISETPKPFPRTSVILTVDANGRARTETVVENSPTKSVQDKYPTLWDGSDSDSETPLSRSTSQWPSRTNSIAYSRPDERQTKMARLDPPSEDLENLHLPRSNSSASLMSLKTPVKAVYSAAAHLRRQSSAKKQRSLTHSRRNTLSSLNSSFESLVSVDSLSSDTSQQTDAGFALRQMMASRGESHGHQDAAPTNTPSKQPQQPSFDAPPHRHHHQKSHSLAAAPMQSYGYQLLSQYPVDCAPMAPPPPMHSPSHNTAPSPSYAPPQHHHHQTPQQQGPIFRCICNLPLDDGRGALACSFCNMFLHAACVGVDPQRPPPQYVCVFCASGSSQQHQQGMQGHGGMMPPGVVQANYAGWGVAGVQI